MITAARRAAAAVLAALVALLVPGTSPAMAADWGRVGALPGLGGSRIWSVAFNPALPATALAATDAGVYRTTDGGQTWNATPVHGTRVWVVGFDVRPGHTAYAGLAGGGVQRSDDGGRSWREVSGGLPDRNVRSLAFGLGGLAVGTSNGVAVSVDGTAWHPAGLDGFDVSAVAVAANSPQFTLVAGTDAGPGTGFLFRNAGPGPAWEPLAQGLPATAVVSSLGAGPLPQSAQFRPLVVATNKGTYHSIDEGTTWTPSTGIAEPLSVTTLGFSQLDPNLVYAGSDAGGSTGGTILRSTDGGASFLPADKGLPADRRSVSSIAVAPAQPPLVMIGVVPPQGGAALYSQIDDTVPPPAAVTGERGIAPAGSSSPPRAVPTPKPEAIDSLAAPEQSGPARLAGAIFHWPFPLTLEVLAALGATALGIRRRQQRLDVDGPP
ncbi:MAG: hypothetical protein JWL78_169 [Chloroflexi bacterium]|nr:hypothetical protein [Chloroflexota bacterium]